MSNKEGRPPLADDPAFLEQVDELDRGLNPEEPLSPARQQPRTQSPAPPRRNTRTPGRVSTRASLPPSIAATFDALTVPDASARSTPPPDSADHEAARPLLALFPPEKPANHAPSATRYARPAPRPRAPLPPPEPVMPPAELFTRIPPSPYETFYGLVEKPFALNSDPRFFYHSAPHDAASQQVLTAIRERQGLVVLTGAPGVGKTTLCRAVIEELDRRTLTSFITDPFVSAEELLTKILADFGVLSRDEVPRGTSATRQELSTTLQSFIESSLAPLEANAVLFVDEAHALPAGVFEQVKLLCEAADASSHLQVILVGQPKLADLLRQPAHKHLHQRVAVRAVLEPLPLDEIGGYVVHRLSLAGTGLRLEFDEGARARLHALSRGVPRVVNLLCDRALAHGYQQTAAVITAAMIDAAAADLDLVPPVTARSARTAQIVVAAAVAFFVLLGAGVAAWVFRDAITRSVAQWKMVPAAPRAPAPTAPPPASPPPPPAGKSPS